MSYKPIKKSFVPSKKLGGPKALIPMRPSRSLKPVSPVSSRALSTTKRQSPGLPSKPKWLIGAATVALCGIWFFSGGPNASGSVASGLKNLLGFTAPVVEPARAVQLRADIEQARKDVTACENWSNNLVSAQAFHSLGDPTSAEMAGAMADALNRIEGSKTEVEMIQNSLEIVEDLKNKFIAANAGEKFKMLRQGFQGVSNPGATLEAADRETLIRNARVALDLARSRLKQLIDQFVALMGYAP